MFFFIFWWKEKISIFFVFSERKKKPTRMPIFACITVFKRHLALKALGQSYYENTHLFTRKTLKPINTTKNQLKQIKTKMYCFFFSCFFHIFSVYWWKNLFLIFFFWKKHPPFFLSLLIITWLLGVIFEYKFLFFTFRSISILYDIIWIKTILF